MSGFGYFIRAKDAPDPDRLGLAQVARLDALRRLRGNIGDDDFERLGKALNIPSKVVRVAKAAVAAGSTTSGNWGEAAADQGSILAAFVAQMRNASVFYRLLESMIRLPVRQRIGLVTMGATAWTLGEGQPIPLTALDLAAAALEPRTAAALLVVTEELLTATSADEGLNNELRRAIGHEVDLQFFAEITDEDTPSIASSGDDADDARLDLLALLTAVGLTNESAPLFVMSPDVARRAATLAAAMGTLMFPQMSPTGGTMLNVPAMVTDALDPGTLALLDGARLIGDAGPINVQTSRQAAVEMQDDQSITQSGATATGAALVSMWQANSVAIRATAQFACLRHPAHDNALATLTNVSWGGEIPVS